MGCRGPVRTSACYSSAKTASATVGCPRECMGPQGLVCGDPEVQAVIAAREGSPAGSGRLREVPAGSQPPGQQMGTDATALGSALREGARAGQGQPLLGLDSPTQDTERVEEASKTLWAGGLEMLNSSAFLGGPVLWLLAALPSNQLKGSLQSMPGQPCCVSHPYRLVLILSGSPVDSRPHPEGADSAGGGWA